MARLIIQPVWLLEKLGICVIQQHIMIVQQLPIRHGMHFCGRLSLAAVIARRIS